MRRPANAYAGSASAFPGSLRPQGTGAGLPVKAKIGLPQFQLRQPDLRLGKMMWRAPSCLFYDYEISDGLSNSTTGILISSFSININI